MATLVRYTALSERTVRTCLDRLEAAGTIRPCDPGIHAARIKRADRRPRGWDLDLSLVREDLGDGDVAQLRQVYKMAEHQVPAEPGTVPEPPAGLNGHGEESAKSDRRIPGKTIIRVSEGE